MRARISRWACQLATEVSLGRVDMSAILDFQARHARAGITQSSPAELLIAVFMRSSHGMGRQLNG